jgi:hypothetical protein
MTINLQIHPISILIKTVINEYIEKHTPRFYDHPDYDSDDSDYDYDDYVFDIDSHKPSFYRQSLYNIKSEKIRYRKSIESNKRLTKMKDYCIHRFYLDNK